MVQRRGHGDGSIFFEHQRQRWVGKLDLPDDGTGKRRRGESGRANEDRGPHQTPCPTPSDRPWTTTRPRLAHLRRAPRPLARSRRPGARVSEIAQHNRQLPLGRQPAPEAGARIEATPHAQARTCRGATTTARSRRDGPDIARPDSLGCRHSAPLRPAPRSRRPERRRVGPHPC